MLSTIKKNYKEDNIELLLPEFRDKIKILMQNMHDRGFNPLLRDSLRTPAEADIFAAKGTGIKNSLHLYGAAADIIDAEKGWKNPLFFDALGEEAEKLGLTWGGRFSRVDKPHIQAIPVSSQYAFRKLKTKETQNDFIKLSYV